MTFELAQHIDFKAIDSEVRESSGLLRDIWFNHEGNQWFPVVIRDRRSGKQGFEVNFSGVWGANDVVGRKKLNLLELITAIATQGIPPNGAVRCKRLNDAQRNGRRFSSMQMSVRLGNLVARVRNDIQSQ